MSIKYYQLAKDEALPDEFCAVRDVGGEPSEYVFYVPEDENAKLRELVRDMNKAAHMLCEAWEGSCSKEAEGMSLHAVCPIGDTDELCVFGRLYDQVRELGVEVDE